MENMKCKIRKHKLEVKKVAKQQGYLALIRSYDFSIEAAENRRGHTKTAGNELERRRMCREDEQG